MTDDIFPADPVDLADTLPTLQLALPPEVIMGIEHRAEVAGRSAEAYLQDLIIEGLITHPATIDPQHQCPSMARVEAAMRSLQAEAARHADITTQTRLYGAIALIARLAMAAGVAEYPSPTIPTH